MMERYLTEREERHKQQLQIDFARENYLCFDLHRLPGAQANILFGYTYDMLLRWAMEHDYATD